MLTNWLQIRDTKKLFNALVTEKDQAKIIHDESKSIQDFINRMLPDYDKIRRFIEDNQANFSLLTESDIEKSQDLIKYLQNDTPQTDFRHKKKLMEELKKSIKGFIEDLQLKTKQTYNEILDELEAEAKSREVEQAHALPSKEYWQEKIKKSNSISQLQLWKANANSFKAEILENILSLQSKEKAAAERAKGNTSSKAAEPVSFYMTRVKASITNEEELNQFLVEVKSEMLKLLHENKIIMIRE